MAFDVEGARKAGYNDEEIANFLGKQSNFDVLGANKAGYGYCFIRQCKPNTRLWNISKYKSILRSGCYCY